MKDYTSTEPVFSQTVPVVETTDPAHADNVNAAPKQLLMNTLVLMQMVETVCDEALVQEMFYGVFSKAGAASGDETAMTAEDIESAIATEWNGESSGDETAMTAEDVEEAINTKWSGESSGDETAITAEDIKSVTLNSRIFFPTTFSGGHEDRINY